MANGESREFGGGVLDTVGRFAKRVGWFVLGAAAAIAVVGGVRADVVSVCEA